MKPTIINFFAGPGAGKSTSSAGLFYKMKLDGFNVELVNEYAKKKTFENNSTALSKQYYVSAKQVYYQEIAEMHYDYVVTDSPILLGSIYSQIELDRQLENENILPAEKKYLQTIHDLHDKFLVETFKNKNNINYFVKRNPETYSEIGRNQSLEDSMKIDSRIENFLQENSIQYTEIEKDFEKQEKEFFKLMNTLKEIKKWTQKK